MNFTNFFRVAFYQNSTGWLLLKVCEISEHWCSHFSPFKKTLHNNYFNYVERVDKLSRENIFMKKILDLDMKVFGLQIWVTLYILLDLDWKPFGQRFIIILTTIFTGAGLRNTWTTKFDYNYYISQDLDFNLPGLRFGFRLLFALLN